MLLDHRPIKKRLKYSLKGMFKPVCMLRIHYPKKQKMIPKL